MSNSIFEQIQLIIVMAIVGSVVVVIGLYVQSLAIVGFGILIGVSLPILGLVLSLLETN